VGGGDYPVGSEPGCLARRMGGAQRYLINAGACGDGYRFAPPILRHNFALSRRIASEVCLVTSRPLVRGRREDRVLAAPAVSRAICANKTAHEHTGQRKHSGLPCAMALRLTSCSSRRTALLPPSPVRGVPLANLTPAPRRPDHTTSPYASRTLACARFASIASHRTFVTMASRPSIG
jgi:hypothetical protein